MSPELRTWLLIDLFAAWCGGSLLWPPAPRREVHWHE